MSSTTTWWAARNTMDDFAANVTGEFETWAGPVRRQSALNIAHKA